MDLGAYIERQKSWSAETFGPGTRLKGVLDHLRKELVEVEENPTDISEWCDLIILALDGAWRSGASSGQILYALEAKQQKNINRVWPDWRNFSEGVAIEHDRTGES